MMNDPHGERYEGPMVKVEFDMPEDEEATREDVLQAMVEGLIQQGREDLVRFIALGRVIDELDRGTDKESLGKFGFGVRSVLGNKAPPQRQLLNLLLDLIYKQADVPRA